MGLSSFFLPPRPPEREPALSDSFTRVLHARASGGVTHVTVGAEARHGLVWFGSAGLGLAGAPSETRGLVVCGPLEGRSIATGVTVLLDMALQGTA